MEHFSDLKEDPRDDKNKKHQFMDILFLVITGDCGCYQWSGGLGGH
jgi:hypothetical protein